MSKDAKVVLTIVGGFVGLAVIGFILVVFVAAFSTTTKTVTEPQAKITTPKPEDDKFTEYLDNAREIFIGGCTDGGASRAICGCMYDWFDENFTNDEFYDLTQDALAGRDIPEADGAAKACADFKASNTI